MKRKGAWLTVHALEQIGMHFTFGIPGVHTTLGAVKTNVGRFPLNEKLRFLTWASVRHGIV